ncbi:hypothetical protein [Nocardioides yefusunii]|uniref:Uncharacterized protein n=1 Tax=Nocardioides yefusunii TaxID=2500546 RepID=A0ABW1QX95_9ACTN|nr:hypothetical protein [Nocardioides yefusunii]
MSTPPHCHDDEPRLAVDPGLSVVVDLAGAPQVRIERDPASKRQEFVPIGSRRPEDLTLTVGGAVGELRPSRAAMTRRSHRVHAVVGGSTYLFTPVSVDESALLRDDVRLGTFARDDDGLAATPDSAEVTPLETALGYALAEAFGTGARSLVAGLFEVASLTPD